MKIHNGHKDPKGNPIFVREFDGLGDLWNAPALHQWNKSHHECGLFGDQNSLSGWHGGAKTVGEAKGILLNGWPKGAEMIRKQIAAVEFDRPEPPRRKPKWTNDGDELNDDRAKMGLLDIAWRACPRTPTPNAMPVRVWVPISASAMYRPDQLFWRGAVAALAVDAMEANGFRVELMAYNQTTSTFESGEGSCYAVKLKDADMPMSFDRLAILAHACFLRVAIFRVDLSCPATATSGLGYPTQPKPWAMWEEGDIVIPHHLFSKDDAEAWLKKMSAEGILPKAEV